MSSTPSEKSHLSIAAVVAALIFGAAMLLAPAADAGKGGGKKGKAKLSVSSIETPPATLAAGAGFTVTGEITNKGKKAGKPGAKLTVELRGTAGTSQIGTGDVPKVGAKKKKSFKADVTVPGNITAGSYSLAVCVRKEGKTGSNGCRVADGTIAVTQPTTPPPPPPPGPTFSAGSRSLNDPYFPQIGNGGYDAKHYLIGIDYDPLTNGFNDGTHTTITLEATQNLSEFSFDFQRAMDVTAVTIDGTPAASFDQLDATPEFAPTVPDATQPAKLVVTPASGILDGTTVDVDVSYSGTPEAITDADESYEGWVQSCTIAGFDGICDGAYTVNEPIGIQSWFPANNIPSDKATIDTSTTVPTTHVALGTGELDTRVTNGDGTWTWNWTEDDQTGVFLATATVGLFDYSNNTSLTENVTGRNIPIYKAIDSAKNAIAKNTFNNNTAAIPTVMNYLSDTFGPYPFDSTGAVTDIAPDVGYALENQTKPHYATSLASNSVGFSASTQVHELSHQWWGDAISPATWSEIWFSEGWATFTENAYDPGPPSGEDTTNLEDFFDDVYSEPDGPGSRWELPPAELGDSTGVGAGNLFDPNGNGFAVYDRPGTMIIGYRFIVGDETFYEWAKELQDTYRYGNISEEQFVQSALDASGFTGGDLDLLEDYFDQWLHSDTKPTLTPDDFL